MENPYVHVFLNLRDQTNYFKCGTSKCTLFLGPRILSTPLNSPGQTWGAKVCMLWAATLAAA